VRGIYRAKSGRESSDTLFAVDLKIENPNDQSIAGLGALDIERSRQRIVAFDEAKIVAWFLQSVSEAIEPVRIEDVPRFEVCDGRRDAEGIFHVVDRGAVLNNRWAGCAGRGALSHCCERQRGTYKKRQDIAKHR